ncbi:MAG: VWA domain-containing protein [Anaerolineae bacterium]
MRHGISRLAGAVTIALGLTLPGATPLAMAAGPTEVKVTQLDASSFPKDPVKVYLDVTDAKGSPLKDLKAENFKLTVDDQPITVKQLVGSDPRSEPTPIQMVLAVDTSRSMKGEPLEKAKAAAIQFIDQLRPGDKVSIWSFDDKPREASPFTDNKDVLKERLSGLTAGPGRTALYDTVFTVSRKVMERTGRRALVVVTHGNNDSSAKGQIAGAVQAAVDAQAPAYLLGFGKLDEVNLETMARETGGEFFKEPSADGMGRLFTQLAELLKGQYELHIDLPVERMDGKSHTVNSSVQIGGKTVRSPAKDIILAPIQPSVLATLTARAKGAGGVTPVTPDGPTVTPDGGGGGGGAGDFPLPLLIGLLALAGLLYFVLRGGKKEDEREPYPGSNDPTWVVPSNTEEDYISRPGPPGGYLDVTTTGSREVPMPAHDPTVMLRQVAKGILQVREGPLKGQQMELQVHMDRNQVIKDTWDIGREGPADLVFNDETVSRRHARIRYESEGKGRQIRNFFVIHDLDAANPTQVNGEVVVKRELKDGDLITIGKSVLVFKQVDLRLPTAGRR